MPKLKSLALVGTVTSLVAGGAPAATDVTFIDGGYAEMCASIATSLNTRGVELTGSRMTIEPLEICTLAIDDEATTPLDRAASYNNRGVLLFAEGRYADAMADFDQALVLMDMLAAAHVNRGYTLVAQKRWAESIPSFDRGIELGAPDPARFVHASEGALHRAFTPVAERAAALVDQGDHDQALNLLAALRPDIDRFFDDVLVMDPDAELQANRRRLLTTIAGTFLMIADFQKLEAAPAKEGG
jgi:tetratricopeptide (TPR) repeat protein